MPNHITPKHQSTVGGKSGQDARLAPQLDHRFKIGDSIIQLTAEIPTQMVISDIDYQRNQYIVMNYETDYLGRVSFTREHLFTNCSSLEYHQQGPRSVNKADIMNLIQLVAIECSGRPMLKSLSNTRITKIYTEWKANL